jgi:Tol biopolymer transport system component
LAPRRDKDLASLGVYTATLGFDANGNATGLDTPPAFLLSVGITEYIEGEGFYPDATYGVSFSPDMTKLAVDHLETGLGWRIFDPTTGVQTTIVTGFADAPAWSPDGGKLAFRVRGAADRIDVVSANGSGRITPFKAARNDYLDAPQWSPDSAHLVFDVYSERTWPPTFDIYRVPATGGGAINLTKDIGGEVGLLGWR